MIYLRHSHRNFIRSTICVRQICNISI